MVTILLTDAVILLTDAVIDILEESRVFLDWKRRNGRRHPESITMVENMAIEPYTGIYAGGNLCTMGSFSYSHSGVNQYLKVGRYCSISWGLTIVGPRHPVDWTSTSNITFDVAAEPINAFLTDHPDIAFPKGDPRLKEKPFPTISNDVWIGQNVTLNRGVHIGDGAVVAAFSVVTKDVPPFTIVGGNPAKPIRLRFPNELADGLRVVPWWNLKPEIVASLPLDNPEEVARITADEYATADCRYTPKVLTAPTLIEAAS